MATAHNKQKPPPPVLRVSSYEKTSSTMVGIVIGLFVAAGVTIMIYLEQHDFSVENETELIEVPVSV